MKFWLLTKRPERVEACLPYDWDDGWENVMFNVTCENQRRADERIPILLELPFKHKGIMCAPFIGLVSIQKYLPTGQIEQVLCDGEDYDGARPCPYEWVKVLHDECREYNTTLVFCTLGSCFVKDGKTYRIQSGKLRSEQAARSGLSFRGKPIEFKLADTWGCPIPEEDLQRSHLIERERLYSIVTAVQLPKSDYLPFNDNSANMNFAQLWAFLIIIPGASIIDRKLYRVTKNPYLAGIITGVIVAIISCCNTTSILP